MVARRTSSSYSQVVWHVLGPGFKSKYAFTLDYHYYPSKDLLNSLVRLGSNLWLNPTQGSAYSFPPSRPLLSSSQQVECYYNHAQVEKPPLVAPSYPFYLVKKEVYFKRLQSVLMLTSTIVQQIPDGEVNTYTRVVV